MNKPNLSLKKLAAAIVTTSTTFGLSLLTQAAVLEEVVVTAQKRAESLQDVPISMSVVDGGALNDMGVKDFTEFKDQVPNFYVQDTPGNQSIYIRGVGSNPGALSFEQTVGLFVDGVYGGHGRQFQNPFLDIGHVEVLRGPQGALVGKNTSAGAVNVTTNKPSDELEASIKAGYEFEADAFNTTAIVSGPFSDTVRGRLVVDYIDSDGFMENTFLRTDEVKKKAHTIRGVLAWDATDAMEVVLKAETAKVDLDGFMFETRSDSSDIKYQRTTDGRGGSSTNLQQDYDNTNTDNYVLTVNYDLDGYTITSITGYSAYDYDKFLDADFTPAPIFISTFAEDFDQLSQEFRLVSPMGDKFDYVAGVYWHTNDLELTQTTNSARGFSLRPYQQDNEALSFYGQGNYQLSDSVRASLSLRWSNERKDGYQKTQNNGNVVRVLSDDFSDNEVDGSVNIQWDVNDFVMVYAGYSDGSKAGGFNGGQSQTTAENFQLDPEKAETWEIGSKMSLLDDAMTLNIAIYKTKFEDLQVSSNIPGTIFFISQNAGSATTQGVEADIAWAISDTLTLRGGMAYLDATYDKFVGANCAWNNPGCDTATNDIGGKTMPKTAEWSGNMSLVYEQPIGDGLLFEANLGLSYSDDRALMDNYDPNGVQEAFTKINLRLAIGEADDKWSVAVVGKNLTDETTFSHAFGSTIGAGDYTYMVDPPRTVAVQFEYRFQ